MKISKVTYKQNFSYNPINMEHIHLGVEIEINEDKEADNAFEMAKQMVHEAYENILKSHPQPFSTQIEKSVQVDKIPDNPVDNMIKAITTCTTPDILQTFEKLSKSKQEFTDAYNNRMGVLLLRSLYTIFDKNDMELPEHYSGRGRTWDEAKKLVEGLNKTGEFKPYTIKNQTTITV